MKKFSPKSSGGKVFCIFYGLIGIPICGVFLATTSDYFSNSFLHLYERRRHKLQKDKWHDIFIAAVIFLLPGLAVFLFIPAAIFTYLEVRTNFHDYYHSRCIFWTAVIDLKDWSYLDATYFSFMTLTTIGFGDIVVGKTEKLDSSLNIIYESCYCATIGTLTHNNMQMNRYIYGCTFY